jgi:hypothetical protein
MATLASFRLLQVRMFPAGFRGLLGGILIARVGSWAWAPLAFGEMEGCKPRFD